MKRILPLVLAALILSACAARYYVSVDSLMADGAKRKYTLSPANEGVSASDLQYREFARYVEAALASEGFTRAASADEAEIAVYLMYGISAPQTGITTVPVVTSTGPVISTTSGRISAHGRSMGYSETTVTSPAYGVVEYVPVSYTYYTSFAVLYAYDMKEYNASKKEVQLWKTTLTCNSSTGDLRAVFPAMIAASSKYIGASTERRITVGIAEDDARISALKGAPAQ